MSVLTVYVGTASTSTCTFQNPPIPSTPVDPSTVTLKFGPAGQAPTIWVYNSFGTITRALDTKGNPYYFAEILATSAGTWITQWIGTGECAVVNFGQFEAKVAPF